MMAKYVIPEIPPVCCKLQSLELVCVVSLGGNNVGQVLT
jgi:hypothetical protein